jgi:hypothetical protein
VLVHAEVAAAAARSSCRADDLAEPLIRRIICHKEAAMGFLAVGAFLVIFYTGERVTALVRKARIERRRAKADYPITGNDPVGRIVV